MGIIFNTAAILSSALTTLALRFNLEPMHAFLVGALLLFVPIKMLLPFGSKKIVSETGIVASVGTIFAFIYLSYSFLYAFAFGVFIGYSYLYWWLFLFPRILR